MAPYPDCAYLDDETYNFCYRRGFRKELVSAQVVDPLAIDLDSIKNRLSELAKNKLSKPYEKQKSSLHRELLSVLASLPTLKTLHSATPGDILKFLVWKDRAGKTKVHRTQCPRSSNSSDKAPSCSCPKRLAVGTVDSMIGKRTIFTNAGLGGEWDDRLGIGNPVSHPSIKQYLKSVKEEQAKARSRPKKAIPIFLGKLEKVAVYIFAQLSAPRVLPIDLHTFSRDLCFLIFSQGTAPDLRGDGENVFAVRRCENNMLCSVKNFVRYLSLCRLMGLDLQSGFLFRTTCGNSVTEQPFDCSAVYNRLKLYLQKINADEGETPHSSRAGCSITLALLGVRKEDISRHVGWASTGMVDFYNDLRETFKPSSPSATLASCISKILAGKVQGNYKAHIDISAFKPAVSIP